jgi:signal transduction histidine kinase
MKRLPTSALSTPVSQLPIDREILIVDDEENVLSVLRRIFENEYVVHSATSGEKGLELLKANASKIALILSDQRMPHMNGTEFLSRSMDIKPDCIRMILTGYTDVKDLIESINSGRVFQYITKPFEADDLLVTVRRGLDYYVKNKELERTHRNLEEAYERLTQAQEQLIQSEKMSMLGQLMGNIAHEIRNPITNIANSAKLLAMDWESVKEMLKAMQSRSAKKIPLGDFIRSFSTELKLESAVEDFEAALQIIDHSCELLTEIVEDLRGFSRMDNAEFVRMDIHEPIERALVLLRSKFKHVVNFHKSFSAVSEIEGLPGPISQVMINLINNAGQAVSAKNGDVWIQTSQSNGKVIVSVRDNGEGIPEHLRGKIFEAGYTTKTDTEGTGLGLTIVQEIMRRHAGHVELRSEVGQGSEFILTFPIDQPRA